MCLVKVKVTWQCFLLHLLRSHYFVTYLATDFLIIVLITIVLSCLSLNKLANNFNCDANLLVPMPSLLISNKKVLSYHWFATDDNFWCRQELKMWISNALFEQKRFSFDNLTRRFLNKRWTLLQKYVKKVSLQITISKYTKSRRGKLMFSRFTQKKLQIHEGTKNTLNTPSRRLLVGGH